MMAANADYAQGDMPGAKSRYSELLSVLGQAPADDPRKVPARKHLALIAEQSGDLPAALAMFRECEQAHIRLFGQDDLAVAADRAHIASIELRIGQADSSHPQYQAAKTSFESTIGPADPLDSVNEDRRAAVGVTVKPQEISPDAQVLQQAREAIEHGALLAANGKHEQGIELLEKAARTHPEGAAGDLARAYLAWARSIQDDPARTLKYSARSLTYDRSNDEAITLMRKAIQEVQKNPDSATDLLVLAKQTAMGGDLASAYVLASQALLIDPSCLSAGHPLFAGAVTSLATYHMDNEDRGRAPALLIGAIGQLPEEDSLSKLQFMELLSASYRKEGDAVNAEIADLQASEMRIRLKGGASAHALTVLAKLGAHFEKQHDSEKARDYFKRALSTFAGMKPADRTLSTARCMRETYTFFDRHNHRPEAAQALAFTIDNYLQTGWRSDAYNDLQTDKISRAIRAKWRPPRRLDTRTAQVRFKLQRGGILYDVRLTQLTGDEAFDTAVLEAVHAAMPLPAVPPGLPEVVEMQMSFQAGQRGTAIR